MRRKRVAGFLKRLLDFFANPRLLLCFGIAWIITNGWAYIMLGAGILLHITWMKGVAGAYIAFLWLPFTAEKIVTVAITIFLLRKLFPEDKKTLAALRAGLVKIKTAYKQKLNKKKDSEGDNDDETDG